MKDNVWDKLHEYVIARGFKTSRHESKVRAFELLFYRAQPQSEYDETISNFIAKHISLEYKP